MSSWLKAILYLTVSAILTRWLPFSSFFRNVDTMVHEFGHALATLLLSGSVMSVSLYEDHSGLTRSLITSSWSLIPISLAGYATASLFAWFLFTLYARQKYILGLRIVSGLALLCLVLFVRNSFGMLWLVGFLVLTVLFMLFPVNIQKYYYLFVAFLCLEESAFAPLNLLMIALRAPGQAGDAANLARVTGFPAVFWAALFLLFALWCAKQAVQAFVGRERPRSRTSSPTPLNYPQR